MYTDQLTPKITFSQLLQYERPQAAAWIHGGSAYPRLSGLAKFYQTNYGGVLVEVEVFGLPNISEGGSSNLYALHIHEFGDCSDDFSKTGSHYAHPGQLHPDHAGDMPPLLGNQGYAWSAFYDKRFRIDDIIGKSVVIHLSRDDFTSQPAGDSGVKIGCGEIKRTT